MKLTEYIKLKLHNAERHIARALKRRTLKAKLIDNIDDLTREMSTGDDIDVKYLQKPIRPSGDLRVRVALRDLVASRIDLWSDLEIKAASLWAEGFSLAATARSLGLENSSGYRLLRPLFNQLSEVCHG